MQRKQVYLTPAEGKRLIGKALAQDARVLEAAREHTLVIVAGTTNGYVAEELFCALGLGNFDRLDFYRGAFKPASFKGAKKSPEQDVIIRRGKLVEGLTIYDVTEDLHAGDMILKGGNSLYLPGREAGVLIGNPVFGTLDPIFKAVMGRRVQLLVPIGLEKRVERPIMELFAYVGDSSAQGLRLSPAPGRAYCEIDALEQSCGVSACLLAGGGIGGYEGGVMLGIEGEKEQLEKADALVQSVRGEKLFGM